MFKAYLVQAYFIDDLIYQKSFKSINNAIKICSGFDPEIHIEIINLISDKIYSNVDVHDMIRIFIDECEDY